MSAMGLSCLIRKGFTYSEIFAINQYFHEAESRQLNKDESGKFRRSESEQREEKPIQKTAKATGVSTDTVSKINQIMEAESKQNNPLSISY